MCFFVDIVFLEPDPVFDSYLQGPIPTVSNVDLIANSSKDSLLTSSNANSAGKK